MEQQWISRRKRFSRSYANRVGWAIFGLLFLVVAVGSASTTQTVEGIRLPLQRHANGRTQVLLTAGRARILGEAGEVEGGIRLFIMTETGETNGVAHAERGVFDLSEHARTADCHGPVSLNMDGIRLSGTNLHWSADAMTIRIETNAVLELDRGGMSMVRGTGI